MKDKLIKRTIEAIKPGPADQFLWDTECVGFGVKVTPLGRKVLLLQYRTPGGRAGATRRLTLGVLGNITVEQGRKLAQEARHGLAKGIDPATEKAARGHAATEAAANTLEAVAALFLDRHGRNLRPKAVSEIKRFLASEIMPTLGRRPITDIKRRDLLALHDKICDRGHKVTANKTISVMKTLLRWAVEREYVEHNVAVGLRLSKETPRARVLSDEELRAVWQAAPAPGWPFGPFIQLLMLTAARRDEVAGLRWSELSADMTVWTLPADRAKTAEGRTILLSEAATALLRDLPQFGNGPWVFSVNGRKPIAGYSGAKMRPDRDSGVSGWVFHDFRRTASTWLAREGFVHEIREAILGHAPVKGIAAVYNTHKYVEECRRALEAWAAHVTGTEPASNVLPLRAGPRAHKPMVNATTFRLRSGHVDLVSIMEIRGGPRLRASPARPTSSTAGLADRRRRSRRGSIDRPGI